MTPIRKVAHLTEDGDLMVLTVYEDQQHGTGLRTATLTSHAGSHMDMGKGNAAPMQDTRRRH